MSNNNSNNNDSNNYQNLQLNNEEIIESMMNNAMAQPPKDNSPEPEINKTETQETQPQADLNSERDPLQVQPQESTQKEEKDQGQQPAQNQSQDQNQNQNQNQAQPNAEHKKSKIPFILLTILVTISVIIAVVLTQQEAQSNKVEIQNPIVTQQQAQYTVSDDEATWKEYNNLENEVYFKYPENVVFTQEDLNSENPSKFILYYTLDESKNNPQSNLNENTITEGFLYRITVTKNVDLKTSQTAASEKVNFFKANCPNTSNVSAIKKGTFSGFESQSFEVTNCKGDYKVTFVKRDNRMYEFLQFARGDIGYIQKYKLTTQKLFNNSRLTNTVAPIPAERWVIYQNTELSLKHPEMDDKCCNVGGPVTLNGFKAPERRIVLATRGTATSQNQLSFNGFGIFVVQDITPEIAPQYIEQQKNALIEEYKVIIGKNPTFEESTIKIDGKDATYIKDIAWWGDIIFLQTTIKNKSMMVVFAKTEVIQDEFNELFDEILGTIKLVENGEIQNPMNNTDQKQQTEETEIEETIESVDN